MRMLAFLGVLALLILAALNPGVREFETFIATQSEGIVREKTGDSALGNALAGAAGSIVGRYVVDKVAEQENYLVFSIFTVDLNGAREPGGEWRFLGVANYFYELERPEALQ